MQRTLGEAIVPLLEELGSMYQEMDKDSGDQNNSDQGRLKGGGGACATAWGGIQHGAVQLLKLSIQS